MRYQRRRDPPPRCVSTSSFSQVQSRRASPPHGNLNLRKPIRTSIRYSVVEIPPVIGVTGGEGRAMSPLASGQTGPLRHAWLIPAGLAAAAVGLLCWGAWVYGYDALYFARSPAWLRDTLQTDQNWTPLVTMALLLSGLGIYWWPRRRKNIPIGMIAILV